MSPTTPPPSAISVVPRSQRASSSASKIVLSVCQSLCASPSGSTIGIVCTPGGSSASTQALRGRAARRVVLVTIATRFCRRCGGQELGALEQAGADVDRVAALAEVDVQRAHVVVPMRRAARSLRGELREPLLESMREAADALVAGVDDQVGDLAIERIALRDRARSASRADRRSAAAAGCGRGACAGRGRAATRAGRRRCRAPRAALRFSGASTAPPPVASTMPSARCTARRASGASRARKPASPSISKITGMRTPVARSISWSRIDEGLAEPPREQPADGGLAGAHQADEKDVAADACGLIAAPLPDMQRF